MCIYIYFIYNFGFIRFIPIYYLQVFFYLYDKKNNWKTLVKNQYYRTLNIYYHTPGKL